MHELIHVDVEQFITKENDDSNIYIFQNCKTIYIIFLAIFTVIMFWDSLLYFYMEILLMGMSCLLHEIKDISLCHVRLSQNLLSGSAEAQCLAFGGTNARYGE